jgi:hypothetical protein
MTPRAGFETLHHKLKNNFFFFTLFATRASLHTYYIVLVIRDLKLFAISEAACTWIHEKIVFHFGMVFFNVVFGPFLRLCFSMRRCCNGNGMIKVANDSQFSTLHFLNWGSDKMKFIEFLLQTPL